MTDDDYNSDSFYNEEKKPSLIKTKDTILPSIYMNHPNRGFVIKNF